MNPLRISEGQHIIIVNILSRMDPCQQPPGPDGNEEADADEEEPSQPSQKRVRFM